jgi:hypothetical protein
VVAPEHPLAWLARTLNELGLSYAVIGAHAVNAWVEPRFTADIDVTIELTAESAETLAQALARAGIVRTREHGARAPSGPDFVRFSATEPSLTLEFQAAKTEFQHEVVRRAVLGAHGVRVATAEDLIVLKLIANRPKDQNDLLGLLALPTIDWAHVAHWAAEWDVQRLLEELRTRARA